MNSRFEGEVEIEIDEKTYRGHWKEERGMVTVSCLELGRKTAHLGRLKPEGLARQMLRELHQDEINRRRQ